MNDILFAQHNWSSVKDTQIRMMRREVDEFEANRLLNTPVDDLREYFVQKYRIDVPVLQEDSIVVDQHETKVDVRHDPRRFILDRSRPALVSGTAIEVDIPFDGDEAMFRIRPTHYNTNPPCARILNGKLRVCVVGADLKSDGVKSTIRATIVAINEYLEWQRQDATGFNSALQRLVTEHLSARRRKLLQDRDLVASLGFPLRPRADANQTFAVPEVRRRVTPTMPKSSAGVFKPEPALSDEQFEHILSVIKRASLVMERSPAAFAKMNEEAIRWHILVQLNGHYEEGTTGETFNFEGKTDVLVHASGKNVFIAECKFWKGPKGLSDAIDQLLGYASWRDTKVAIILFNRRKNFSRVLEAIPKTVEGHSNYKRHAKGGSDTDFRYVLRHRDDKSRELTLAVVAFEVPSGETLPDA